MRPLLLALFVILASTAAAADNVHGVSLDPEIVAVTVGETTTAIATVATPGAEIYFNSQNPGVAEVSGRIARGASSGVVTITGLSAGEVVIGYLVPNFGRAPGGGTVGSVIVAPCVAPSFMEQPRGAVIVSGQTATLTARATGAATYRWYADSELVGTGEVFTTPKLSTSTEYVVEAENACGKVRSDVARVVIASRRRSVR